MRLKKQTQPKTLTNKQRSSKFLQSNEHCSQAKKIFHLELMEKKKPVVAATNEKVKTSGM